VGVCMYACVCVRERDTIGVDEYLKCLSRQEERGREREREIVCGRVYVCVCEREIPLVSMNT